MIRRFLQCYLDDVIPRRRKELRHRLALKAIRAIRPDWIKWREQRCREIEPRRRVSVLSCTDAVLDHYLRFQCGDFWAKYELTRALGELGYLVTDVEPDVVIHLFSYSTALPPRAYKILWIYSHPERVTPELLGRYDRIFCLSSTFTEKIRAMGFTAEYAPGATAHTPLRNELRYDIVFVGNTRQGVKGGRWVIGDLGDVPYDLTVWGKGWEEYLPPHRIGGAYFDYTRLSELYSAARISFCDHWPEMRQEGFVALRVFDILGSGGFCISDANAGIEEIFGEAVPQYRSPNELRELVDFYIQNPEERLKLMQRGQEIALSHSWRRRASQFMQGIDTSFLGSQQGKG